LLSWRLRGNLFYSLERSSVSYPLGLLFQIFQFHACIVDLLPLSFQKSAFLKTLSSGSDALGVPYRTWKQTAQISQVWSEAPFLC
jgi:hypothetical protein